MLDIVCEPAKLIVCTLPQGLGADIITNLYEKSEIINIQHDTGRAQYAHDTTNEWQEIDMLTVIVKEAFADEVFKLIYELTNMYAEEGRYVYQAHLPAVTPFKLPLMREITSGELVID
jgi:hypothetical protein